METLRTLARLVNERNEVESRISAITGRPGSIGHLGEFIASQIFDISLAANANFKSIDGWFASGPFEGKSVNVKWYAKHEGLLDMCVDTGPDSYLVLCGPEGAATRQQGPRPWLIESVYLFEEVFLKQTLTSKIGIATSVKRDLWRRNEIFPEAAHERFVLSEEQRRALSLFGSLRPR